MTTAEKLTTHEYAFDVKLFAVVRVNATSEQAARKGLAAVLQCMDLSDAAIDGMNDVLGLQEIKITEASMDTDDSVYNQGADLFEIDGEEVQS